MSHDQPLAIFSEDKEGPDGRGKYRFTLWRRNLQDGFLFIPPVHGGSRIERIRNAARGDDVCNFICLNPSTADERLDDPTIRRCWGFAQLWGYDSFLMTNVFAFRATDPKVMKAYREPTGDPTNEGIIYRCAERAGMIVLGWGTHATHNQRAAQIEAILRPMREKVFCLRRNDDGSPEHPLYIPALTVPELYFHE